MDKSTFFNILKYISHYYYIMHDSSLIAGKLFAELYGKSGMTVVDVGGRDVNGSLRSFFVERGMKYICVDMETHPSVDVVVPPGEKLPFDDSSIDLIVSTSCFEHDPCFWLTFKEMCRIVKLDGHIYINAPTHGEYHCYPGDNWRFYSDAGQALAYWAGKQMGNELVYPVKVIETFHIYGTQWHDWVCVWKKVLDKETNITVDPKIVNTSGILESALRQQRWDIRKKC
ncbi:methyltransferase [Klosneuvirus KNV1]|uniref:Methyltransferase n=1 Tax=Klosneuvirus KNV1 TaxID=1977640 RepID=A0A1V0SL84_9VIRU|nr:methyltransferase [Klosneuvirus KNV1]